MTLSTEKDAHMCPSSPAKALYGGLHVVDVVIWRLIVHAFALHDFPII